MVWGRAGPGPGGGVPVPVPVGGVPIGVDVSTVMWTAADGVLVLPAASVAVAV
jgi:hypothetical protein